MASERFEKIKKLLSQRQPDLTVLIEDVVKPHNLAAIARTCDAVGIPEVHAVSTMRGLRLSQMAAGGIRKWVQLHKHATTEDAFKQLKQNNMQLIVTHLSDDTIDYTEVDYTKPTAIIAGSEFEGVSEYAVKNADHCISIPMLGMVQSLNVSAAMSIILYEAQKQRAKAGLYDTRRIDDETYNTKLFEYTHPKVTQFCKEHKQNYPEMDDEGEIIGNILQIEK